MASAAHLLSRVHCGALQSSARWQAESHQRLHGQRLQYEIQGTPLHRAARRQRSSGSSRSTRSAAVQQPHHHTIVAASGQQGLGGMVPDSEAYKRLVQEWQDGDVTDAAVATPISSALPSSNVVVPRAQRQKPAPVMPYVMTPFGPTDLMSAFYRNRIIFVGSTINATLAQRVISQLMALAAIDDEQEIKMYINCPGGSTYSLLAIYDCIAWIKPDVSTVAFGMTASQGALLLAAGTKGKRFAMPNARIMIHQPQGGCGGTAEDVRRQVNEVMQSRDKLDKMFAAFTGQPLETIQKFTERDRFFSAAEAQEFGLIDGVLQTEY